MEAGPDILILEDEMMIAMDVEASLKEAGYGRIRICATPNQARRLMQERMPNVALLDVNLGRQRTSFGVAESLLQAGCRILFMTGYTAATVDFPPGLTEVGRVSKPFDGARLRAAVDALIEDGARPEETADG